MNSIKTINYIFYSHSNPQPPLHLIFTWYNFHLQITQLCALIWFDVCLNYIPFFNFSCVDFIHVRARECVDSGLHDFKCNIEIKCFFRFKCKERQQQKAAESDKKTNKQTKKVIKRNKWIFFG